MGDSDPISCDGGVTASIIASAGHHLPRHEGAALARQLMQASSRVTHVYRPRLVHSFLGLDQVSPAAAEASREIFERLGSLLREQLGELQRRKLGSVTRLGFFVGGRWERRCHVPLADFDDAARHAKLKYCLR
jgi:hypothetical protein